MRAIRIWPRNPHCSKKLSRELLIRGTGALAHLCVSILRTHVNSQGSLEKTLLTLSFPGYGSCPEEADIGQTPGMLGLRSTGTSSASTAVSCMIFEPSPMFSSTVRSSMSVGNTGGLSLMSCSVISTYKERRNMPYE